MAYVVEYKCARCGSKYKPNIPQTVCKSCNGPLLAVYDIELAKKVLGKHVFSSRPNSMWRYLELLPISDERNIVSLGEGYTPLIKLERLREKLGLKNLYMKDEGRNPTATFKDRPISATVSVLKELNVKSVAIPTAGNAGASLAAYGVRAGLDVHIVMPSDTPKTIYMEAVFHNVDVKLVNGLISDAGKYVAEAVSRYGWFDISTMKVPYRVEGTKTMGFEVCEQLGWSSPDVIIFPTGGGEGVIGIWKAFKELIELGWVKRMPRIVVVQSECCKPIVSAYNRGSERVEFFSGCKTIASGLRVPKPFADKEILKIIRESGGTAVDVSEKEIINSLNELASKEGILACPEGAAAYAAVKKLLDYKLIDKDEETIVYNTGSGLKYMDLLYQTPDT
ncbi:MAG: threonine synthase [Nitrososphaeria archaeon]|nr:threonine synthase [Nitrososphaeria archaeon]